jgi:hypothetical protein
VIGAPNPEQAEPVRAVAARRTLTCDTLDAESLAAFRDNWFEFVRSQQAP